MKHLIALLVALVANVAWAEIRVPAFTAYIEPDSQGASVSEEQGIRDWRDPANSINWYGKFARTGQLTVKVQMRTAAPQQSFELTIADQTRQVTLSSSEPVADFGTFTISSIGHHRLTLKLAGQANPASQSLADVTSLVLDGPASQDAHFNLKERRNAASVHLFYPVPKDVKVEAFACEATGIEDPVATYYMACGWHRGYFGMQVNSPSERRIIFSVWDSGDEAVSRNKVNEENRVKLIDKGEGVFTGDFGNEGTGGHSHLKVMWKTGQPQRFVVTARPVDETFTIYSGYWYRHDQQKWMLISAWKAPKEGGYMHGLYSFSENFGGDTGYLHRKALFGNQWIRTPEGKWIELTKATFSHDPTGQRDRLDRSMGIENGWFYLSHGGFLDAFTEYGKAFTRPATNTPPQFP